MFLKVRDSTASDDDYYYSPWWNWGRWVMLAVVIVFVVATALSFVAKRKQLRHHNAQYAEGPNIPLGPVYPHDPTMMNPPPPKYEPEGVPYTPAPAWTPPAGPEKGYGSQYAPPPGPPPASAAVASSSSPSPSGYSAPGSSGPNGQHSNGYTPAYYAPPAAYGSSIENRM